MDLKQCSKCEEWMSIDAFARDKYKPSGRTSSCLKCRAKATQAYRAAYPEVRGRSAYSREKQREYYWANRDKMREYSRKSRQKRKDRINRAARLRCAFDPSYRIVQSLRGRLNHAVRLQGVRRCAGTVRLLGCDAPTLRAHIEAQFLPGMTWENHGKGPGKWHIDHIDPCALFDLTDPEQQQKCFHYTNLRPRWQHDNLADAWAARKVAQARKNGPVEKA